MAKRDSSKYTSSEARDIRRELEMHNENYYDDMTDQLGIAVDKSKKFLIVKAKLLEKYANILRSMSNDDMAQEIIDNILEQLERIRKEFSAIMESSIDEQTKIMEVDGTRSQFIRLSRLIERLYLVEKMVYTRLGASKDDSS